MQMSAIQKVAMDSFIQNLLLYARIGVKSSLLIHRQYFSFLLIAANIYIPQIILY